jgi:FAD/FMN-containing dehydrogenase
MSSFEVRTRPGGQIVLEESVVQKLKANLRGELLRPGDETYDETRTVWNGMIDHRPALIARCAGVADVIGTVSFARDHDLLVSVRGGGHNIAGKGVCTGGLMIDLSRMRSVAVDPLNRTARVEGGATLGELDGATQASGLATTAGVVTHTGVAGLTLGGGVGRLARRYGLACDNLLSVDLVTADGQAVRTSATENSDLFWGVRGAGANFGVATSFEFQLHPSAQACWEASWSIPWRRRGRRSGSITSTRGRLRTSCPPTRSS